MACLAEREDAHLAGFDQVEALRGAAFVEEDHVLGEDAPAQAVSQRGQFVFVQVCEQRHPAQRIGNGHPDLRSAIRQSQLECSDRRTS